MEALTFWNLMKISLVMPVLLFLSILLVAYALERALLYLRVARVNGRFLEKVRELVRYGKIKDALELCKKQRGFLPKAIAAQLSTEGLSKQERDGVLSLYHQRLQVLLSRRLGLFGTLSFISPLLGLLGTVLGVIRSFRDLAVSGSGGPTIVAAGISEALVSTAAGIAVAVTAALVYNYFQFKMKDILSTLLLFGQEIMFLMEHKREV
jgi:biopolymer transport protein ExbB